MLEHGVTVGQYLQRQREANNISLENVAQRTRIKLAYLKALEEEAFHRIPAEPYVRGFLRCYAKFIGLDPSEVLAVYRNQVEPPPNNTQEKKAKSSPLIAPLRYILHYLF